MQYYANHGADGALVSISTGAGETEISVEEYVRLEAWIVRVNSFADQVFAGEIAMEDVPEADREDVAERVQQQREMAEEMKNAPLTADEVLSIILGGENA